MTVRNSLYILVCLAFACTAQDKQTGDTTKAAYSKSDLSKAKWITGKWKGMDGSKPFYEMYEMPDDSTIKITSYDWNGKDSSNTSVSTVHWKNGSYYLGEDDNWRVTTLDGQQIIMEPVKASNSITWKTIDAGHWQAVLTGKKGAKTYEMVSFDPFSK